MRKIILLFVLLKKDDLEKVPIHCRYVNFNFDHSCLVFSAYNGSMWDGYRENNWNKCSKKKSLDIISLYNTEALCFYVVTNIIGTGKVSEGIVNSVKRGKYGGRLY